jgi:hypothetical protein
LKTLRGVESTFSRLNVETCLPLKLKEAERNRHTPGQLDPVLMQQEDVVNVDDAPNAYLLQYSQKGAQ